MDLLSINTALVPKPRAQSLRIHFPRIRRPLFAPQTAIYSSAVPVAAAASSAGGSTAEPPSPAESARAAASPEPPGLWGGPSSEAPVGSAVKVVAEAVAGAAAAEVAAVDASARTARLQAVQSARSRSSCTSKSDRA